MRVASLMRCFRQREKVMFRTAIVAGLLVAVSIGNAHAMAKDGCGGDCTSCHSLTEKEAGAILHWLGTVKSVKQSPVRGLFELRLERDGKEAVAYMDYGKKNLVAGQIFDIAARQPATSEITGQSKKTESVDVDKIPLANALIIGNPKGTKKLYVFTDPDCPYCAKLHGELKKLVTLEPDLAIYIKMFPLKMHPQAYDKARVILGKKSLELLDAAFAGDTLPAPVPSDFASAVDDSIKFAESIGVSSTPTLVLADGRMMPGFMDAAALQKLLSQKNN